MPAQTGPLDPLLVGYLTPSARFGLLDDLVKVQNPLSDGVFQQPPSYVM
jgi:hypothetical protein